MTNMRHLFEPRSIAVIGASHDTAKIGYTLTLQKYLVQKRFARSISGHQETIDHFQDLNVCSIRFRP
jgi:hypothetical protein